MCQGRSTVFIAGSGHTLLGDASVLLEVTCARRQAACLANSRQADVRCIATRVGGMVRARAWPLQQVHRPLCR